MEIVLILNTKYTLAVFLPSVRVGIMKPIHWIALCLLVSVFCLVGVFAMAAYKGAYDGAYQAYADYLYNE